MDKAILFGAGVFATMVLQLNASAFRGRSLHTPISNLWSQFKEVIPRRAKKEEPVKISPSPHHSLAAISQTARHEAFEARCSAFKRFSCRTQFVRYSCLKLNSVARLLPGLSLPMAEVQMRFQLKKGARLACLPAIRDAANQVKQRRGDPNEWVIEQALVGRGRYRKRVDIKGRGRVGVQWRPSSFLRLVVAKPDAAGKLKRELRRALNRQMRGVLREDKPSYCSLRY